ncbi:MAG: class I SAM-dependent methyltransferase [Thermoanaerobaculia bacterium]
MPTYPFKDFDGSSHRVLARLIPRWSRLGGRLVDLGASGGELGHLVRHHFKETFAFEREIANIGALAGRFDKVVMADLEHIESIPAAPDAVVLADVLEHMRDPQILLRRTAEALPPGGRAFISLPNVACLPIRLHLLAGRFTYADRGILDRTHLRFFTRGTAREEIERSGLRVLHVQPTLIPIRLVWPGAPRPLIRVAEWMLGLATRIRPTLLAYQFVFVCGRAACPERSERVPARAP